MTELGSPTQVQLDRGDSSGDNDPFEHVWCCDPDVAVCGADVSGDEDIGWDVPFENPCPMCEAVTDLFQGMACVCGKGAGGG